MKCHEGLGPRRGRRRHHASACADHQAHHSSPKRVSNWMVATQNRPQSTKSKRRERGAVGGVTKAKDSELRASERAHGQILRQCKLDTSQKSWDCSFSQAASGDHQDDLTQCIAMPYHVPLRLYNQATIFYIDLLIGLFFEVEVIHPVPVCPVRGLSPYRKQRPASDSSRLALPHCPFRCGTAPRPCQLRSWHQTSPPATC